MHRYFKTESLWRLNVLSTKEPDEGQKADSCSGVISLLCIAATIHSLHMCSFLPIPAGKDKSFLLSQEYVKGPFSCKSMYSNSLKEKVSWETEIINKSGESNLKSSQDYYYQIYYFLTLKKKSMAFHA